MREPGLLSAQPQPPRDLSDHLVDVLLIEVRQDGGRQRRMSRPQLVVEVVKTLGEFGVGQPRLEEEAVRRILERLRADAQARLSSLRPLEQQLEELCFAVRLRRGLPRGASNISRGRDGRGPGCGRLPTAPGRLRFRAAAQYREHRALVDATDARQPLHVVRSDDRVGHRPDRRRERLQST